MSYTSKGQIPEKYALRIVKNDFKQGYFFGAEEENKDFDEINKALSNNNKIYEVVSIKSTKQTDIIMENNPIKLKLIGASNSTYGKFVSSFPMKVMLPDGHIVSITSDVILESLYKDGCGKEGMLNSEFIMASNGKTYNFIRLNSKVHEACKERMGEISKPVLKTKDFSFEFGKVYKKNTGNYGLFLGYINTSAITLKTEYMIKNGLYYLDNIKQNIKETKMATLWVEIDEFSSNNMDICLTELETILNESRSHWKYKYKIYKDNTHKYVHKTEYKIDFKSPKDIIYNISNLYLKHVEKHLESLKQDYEFLKKNQHTTYGFRRTISLYDFKRIYDYSKYVNLEIFGAPTRVNKIYSDMEKNWFNIIVETTKDIGFSSPSKNII